MSEWKEYKLGDIASFSYGKLPKHDLLGKGSYVTFSGYKYIERYPEYNCEKGDVILVARGVGGTGDVKITSQRCFLTNLSIKIELDNSIVINDYFYNMFRQDNLRYLDSGSAQSQITIQDLANVIIEVPPIDEQQRIAGVLSSLDDKIDLLNRENATLEALAETLFRHYFIENPDPTWKEGKLGDYVIETIGGEWGTEVPEGESNMPVRCLRGADVADLNDGIATRTPLRYIKPSKYEKIKPNNGDIILEISGGTDTCSTGRVAYINDSVKHLFDYPIVFSNFCRLLRVKEKYMYFVYCYFRHLHKQGEFFNLENGSSGIHNLNYKAALYDDLGWPVPTDKKLVIEFGEKVKPYFDKINANKKQILSLSAQRDGILPRLMSGEVKMTESKITDKYILFNN